MSVIWRRAYLSDAPLLGALHHETWQQTYADLYPRKLLDSRTPAFFHGLWEGFLQDDRRPALIALVESQPHGLLRYSADGEVCTLYVRPSMQRRGVADTLLEEAELDMRRIGNETFRTYVVADNEPARTFFGKNGYDVVRDLEAVFDEVPMKLVELTKPANR